LTAKNPVRREAPRKDGSTTMHDISTCVVFPKNGS
jgi:hypothetical protein